MTAIRPDRTDLVAGCMTRREIRNRSPLDSGYSLYSVKEIKEIKDCNRLESQAKKIVTLAKTAMFKEAKSLINDVNPKTDRLLSLEEHISFITAHTYTWISDADKKTLTSSINRLLQTETEIDSLEYKYQATDKKENTTQTYTYSPDRTIEEEYPKGDLSLQRGLQQTLRNHHYLDKHNRLTLSKTKNVSTILTNQVELYDTQLTKLRTQSAQYDSTNKANEDKQNSKKLLGRITNYFTYRSEKAKNEKNKKFIEGQIRQLEKTKIIFDNAIKSTDSIIQKITLQDPAVSSTPKSPNSDRSDARISSEGSSASSE